MEIKRIDHDSGKGEYIVQDNPSPSLWVTLFGPATHKECERYIDIESIEGTRGLR